MPRSVSFAAPLGSSTSFAIAAKDLCARGRATYPPRLSVGRPCPGPSWRGMPGTPGLLHLTSRGRRRTTFRAAPEIRRAFAPKFQGTGPASPVTLTGVSATGHRHSMRGLRGGENGRVLLLILLRCFEKQRSLLPGGRSADAEDFGGSRRLIRANCTYGVAVDLAWLTKRGHAPPARRAGRLSPKSPSAAD